MYQSGGENTKDLYGVAQRDTDMKLHSVYFGSSKSYERFAQTLQYSATKNSPNTPLIIHSISEENLPFKPARSGIGPSRHDYINTIKTIFHNQIMQQAEDGELVGMLDLDLLILGDLSAAEEGDYDLGVTTRPQKSTINSGVVFVRVSPKTKSWYQDWCDRVLALFREPQKLRRLKARYAGINQSALGLKLTEKHDLKIKEFPGVIWNCTPINYIKFSPETKVLHLLEEGRFIKRNLQNSRGKLHKVQQVWGQIEMESKEVQHA